jgi:hypothetical protein
MRCRTAACRLACRVVDHSVCSMQDLAERDVAYEVIDADGNIVCKSESVTAEKCVRRNPA